MKMYIARPLLPDFVLDTRVLWRMNFPNYFELGEMVKQMLEKAE